MLRDSTDPPHPYKHMMLALRSLHTPLSLFLSLSLSPSLPPSLSARHDWCRCRSFWSSFCEDSLPPPPPVRGDANQRSAPREQPRHRRHTRRHGGTHCLDPTLSRPCLDPPPSRLQGSPSPSRLQGSLSLTGTGVEARAIGDRLLPLARRTRQAPIAMGVRVEGWGGVGGLGQPRPVGERF